MFDALLTIPWWVYCAILTFGSAGYGISMRFVGKTSHPSIPCFIFTSISTVIAIILCTLYVLSGHTLEFTNFGIVIAIISGTSLVGVDLSIIAMYNAGAPISLGMPLIRIGMALLTAVIGILFFAENITVLKTLGIIMGSVGIFLTIPEKEK